MKARWLLAVSMMGTASPAMAQVAYHVDFTDPVHQRAMVSATFPAAPGDTIDVKMPAWRTGAYTIRDLADGVSRFSAVSADGKPLEWHKVNKSTWRIDRGPGPVTVSYELYADELTSRTRHIDDSHAYLDASATFVYADVHRGEPVTVTLDTPEGWRSFSGMDSRGTNGFAADNYDVLVDSPIETGVNQSRDFKANGKDYTLVTWGGGIDDIDKMAGDLSKLVSASVPQFWDSYPFDRYVFMVHGTDQGGGATEHMNSTVIQLPRQYFGLDRGYNAFLSTASHEFIHTWNVKAYRPAPMVPYDYDRENYTNLFWVAEGSTSYFTDHVLLQAGLIDTPTLLDNLGGLIEGNRARPGRLVQSVAEASFDEWISPESSERSQNDWVNIYSQGEMVSWMLDLALLDMTDGKVAYRDVHEALYQRAKSGKQGYDEGDILAILKEKTGEDWGDWWQSHVHEPVDPDYGKLLATVGLKLTDKPKVPSIDARLSAVEGGEGGQRAKIANLTRGGAAWNAGLNADDVIVSLNGEAVTPKQIDGRISAAKAGDKVTVGYIRRGETRENELTIGSTYDGAPEIAPVAQPSARQKMLFERWLRVPFPTAG